MFNDTYKFSLKDKDLELDKKDIAWKSDKDYKFGSQVYPKNFQSGGSLGIGGGKLKDNIPVSTPVLVLPLKMMILVFTPVLVAVHKLNFWFDILKLSILKWNS